MIRTVEAVIDANGEVRLAGPLKLNGEHRALVMILDVETPGPAIFASEHCLSEWNLPEEEYAWMHLQ